MPRLPIPGSDNHMWGGILNEYLGVVHEGDGTLRSNTVGSSQIIDGSIVNANINAAAAIDQSKISNLTTNLSSKTDKSTLTTKGDIYAASAASAPARLPVGSDDQVLTADSTQATGLRWSPAAIGDMTLAGVQTVTGAKTFEAGTFLDQGSEVYNVKSYGATGDGSTDDTAAVQAAVNACLATGGTVFFPQGRYKLQPGLVSPVFNTVTVEHVKPLKLLGVSPDWRTTIGAGATPSGASILDFQGTPIGQGVACIEMFGTGYMEVEGLHFWQSGTAHTLPYIYSTNTTLMIHNCGFQGHASKSGTGCNQDAIIVGAVLPPDVIASTYNSRFQGYGTVIQNNVFQRMRRAVWGRRATNGIVVRDNTIWSNCGSDGGSLAASGAAIEFQGVSTSHTVGVTLIGNLVETSGYYTGIRMGDYTTNSTIAFNNMYDPGVQTVCSIHVTATGSQRHLVIAGYHADTTPFVQDDAGFCTVLNYHQAQTTEWKSPFLFSYNGSAGNEGLRVSGNARFGGGNGKTLIQPDNDASLGGGFSLIMRRASDHATDPNGNAIAFRDSEIEFRNTAGAIVEFTANGRTWQGAGAGSGAFLIFPGTGQQIDIRGTAMRYLRAADAAVLAELRPAPHSSALGGLRLNGTTWVTSGTGTPEGVVTAPVGSLFARTDGGAGTTLYVKESGAGNTGWIAK